jgi:preprotein translocase subunit SecE
VARAKAKKGNAIVRYMRETRAELRKVNWPSREETVHLARIVLGVTGVMGIFLWMMDVLFSWWLEGVLVSDPWRIGGSVVLVVVIIVVVGVVSRR